MTEHRWGIMLVVLGLLLAFAAPAVAQRDDDPPPTTQSTTTSNAMPVAAFNAYLADGGGSTTVLFDATPSADSDGTIVSYQWLFGDGTSGTGAEVEHTYPRVDEYEVSLVVVDNGGASHITSKRIDLSTLGRRGSTMPSASAPSTPAPSPSSAPVGNAVGNRAPDFALPTLDGDIARLSEYLGQVVVIDFFFGTCSGCIATLPHLVELEAHFEATGVVVIVIVLDRDPASVSPLFGSSEYEGLTVVHEHDSTRPTRTAYGVKGTPHAFLIDKHGVIRFSGSPTGLSIELVARWL